MWFHLSMCGHNHHGRKTLYEMFQWFEAGLTEAGHTVTLDERYLEPGAINVLWENFSPGFGVALQETGVTYGIIATEIPDGEGFNWRRDAAWMARWEGFAEAAASAAFVWTTVEQAVPFYSRFAPTAFVELGFSERLVTDFGTTEPDIDFGFYGLATQHRAAVVERLRQHAQVAWPKTFLEGDAVPAFLSRIRIGLTFRQSESWPIPSPTRLGRLLHARRGVAAEWTPQQTRQSRLVSAPREDEDFVEFALGRLEGPWREEADHTFDAYRSTLPMRTVMEQVLEATLAGATRLPSTSSAPVRPKLLDPVPIHVESVNGYSIVEYHGRYYGIPWAAGAVDLATMNDADLSDRVASGDWFCHDRFSEVREQAQSRPPGETLRALGT